MDKFFFVPYSCANATPGQFRELISRYRSHDVLFKILCAEYFFRREYGITTELFPDIPAEWKDEELAHEQKKYLQWRKNIWNSADGHIPVVYKNEAMLIPFEIKWYQVNENFFAKTANWNDFKAIVRTIAGGDFYVDLNGRLPENMLINGESFGLPVLLALLRKKNLFPSDVRIIATGAVKKRPGDNKIVVSRVGEIEKKFNAVRRMKDVRFIYCAGDKILAADNCVYINHDSTLESALLQILFSLYGIKDAAFCNALIYAVFQKNNCTKNLFPSAAWTNTRDPDALLDLFLSPKNIPVQTETEEPLFLMPPFESVNPVSLERQEIDLIQTAFNSGKIPIITGGIQCGKKALLYQYYDEKFNGRAYLIPSEDCRNPVSAFQRCCMITQSAASQNDNIANPLKKDCFSPQNGKKNFPITAEMIIRNLQIAAKKSSILLVFSGASANFIKDELIQRIAAIKNVRIAITSASPGKQKTKLFETIRVASLSGDNVRVLLQSYTGIPAVNGDNHMEMIIRNSAGRMDCLLRIAETACQYNCQNYASVLGAAEALGLFAAKFIPAKLKEFHHDSGEFAETLLKILSLCGNTFNFSWAEDIFRYRNNGGSQLPKIAFEIVNCRNFLLTRGLISANCTYSQYDDKAEGVGRHLETYCKKAFDRYETEIIDELCRVFKKRLFNAVNEEDIFPILRSVESWFTNKKLIYFSDDAWDFFIEEISLFYREYNQHSVWMSLLEDAEQFMRDKMASENPPAAAKLMLCRIRTWQSCIKYDCDDWCKAVEICADTMKYLLKNPAEKRIMDSRYFWCRAQLSSWQIFAGLTDGNVSETAILNAEKDYACISEEPWKQRAMLASAYMMITEFFCISAAGNRKYTSGLIRRIMNKFAEISVTSIPMVSRIKLIRQYLDLLEKINVFICRNNICDKEHFREEILICVEKELELFYDADYVEIAELKSEYMLQKANLQISEDMSDAAANSCRNAWDILVEFITVHDEYKLTTDTAQKIMACFAAWFNAVEEQGHETVNDAEFDSLVRSVDILASSPVWSSYDSIGVSAFIELAQARNYPAMHKAYTLSAKYKICKLCDNWQDASVFENVTFSNGETVPFSLTAGNMTILFDLCFNDNEISKYREKLEIIKEAHQKDNLSEKIHTAVICYDNGHCTVNCGTHSCRWSSFKEIIMDLYDLQP